MCLVLVFTYSSLWEGMDSALGLKKHLGKWKTFTSIALLKTLFLSGLSRICSRSQVLCLYIARSWDWVFLGDWCPLGALLCKLGQESLQCPQWRTPPGSPEDGGGGTSQRYTLLLPVIFHLVTTWQHYQPRKHAREPGCDHLSHISNISACYPASGYHYCKMPCWNQSCLYHVFYLQLVVIFVCNSA